MRRPLWKRRRPSDYFTWGSGQLLVSWFVMKTITESPNASAVLDALTDQWRGKRPVSITVNEKHQFAIDDERSFVMLLQLIERLENLEAIQNGLDDFEAGRTMS